MTQLGTEAPFTLATSRMRSSQFSESNDLRPLKRKWEWKVKKGPLLRVLSVEPSQSTLSYAVILTRSVDMKEQNCSLLKIWKHF